MQTRKMMVATILTFSICASSAMAQLSNPEISGAGSGSMLLLSADGSCWDDCWVQTIPLGQGTAVAIMKGDQVVDQGFVETSLNVASDDPGPPADGFGTVSVSFAAQGQNGAGEPGWYFTTITYTYSNYILRDVKSETEFVKDSDPPAGEGEDG